MTKEDIDRTGWGTGPWDGESDREEWIDEDTNYHCIAIRNRVGNWCGYVGVPESHPGYNFNYDGVPSEIAEQRMGRFRENMKKYSDIKDYPSEPEYTGPFNQAIYDIRVHGGLTYSGKRTDTNLLWYFGFDCGHCYDYSPGLRAQLNNIGYNTFMPRDEEIYRDLKYVKSECRNLAKQLANMEDKNAKDTMDE